MGEKISNFRKFYLLLWKNFQLVKSHKCQLACDILCPFICIFVLIVFPRIIAEAVRKSAISYDEFSIDNLKVFGEKFIPDKTRNNIIFELAYAPENEYINRIMNQTALTFHLQGVKAFKNGKAMNNALLTNKYLAAVQFDDGYANLKDYPNKFRFKLRFPSELRIRNSQMMELQTWRTNVLHPDFPKSGPRNIDDKYGGIPVGYMSEGFVPIQHALSMAYIGLAAGENNMPEVVMQRFPYPPFIDDMFLSYMETFLPLLLVFSFSSSCAHIARYVGEEREKQLKEVMKLMGIPNWIHWSAWFVRFISVLASFCIILVLLFKWKPKEVAVFTYSDSSFVFVFFVTYIITIICFSFMIAVFFKKRTTGSMITGLIFLISYFPYSYVNANYNNMNLLQKSLLCLNLNFAMPMGIKIICGWEGTGEGAKWSNVFEPVNDDDNLSLSVILLMMLLSAFIYMLICLYVEEIFPGEFGVAKKWNFPLKREYWCGQEHRLFVDINESKPTVKYENSEVFEKEPKNKRIGIEVKALGKRYGENWAVKELSLNMYEDEITVLLGHNGAGKTTTISMLTGMLSPTTGTAYINGCDIRTDIEGARSSMGICPQHNVLFDDMSVANHLKFFAKLKGLKGEAVKAEINKYLNIIELKPKANALSKTLSGGMKRKLTLCCAFCGGNKVVLCDEPSSGMDPAARRQLWDLLQSEKIGRTILLTTHFMDEAEVLGDRIAIMCNGELKCYGSPFFLKKHFGSGYRLICVKKENCNVDEIGKLLSKYIPGIKPESEIGTELTYRLPNEYSNVFGKMFRDLEENSIGLGVNGFGIGISSMEEVFMKVGAENADLNWLTSMKKQSKLINEFAKDTDNSETTTTTEPVKSDDENLRNDDGSDSDYYDAVESNEEDYEIEKNRKRGGDDVAKHKVDKVGSFVDFQDKDETFVKQRKERGAREEKQFNKERKYFNGSEAESQNLQQSEGSLARNQLHAMFYKKFLYTWRNILILILQIAEGMLSVICATYVVSSLQLKELPPITFSLKQYSKAVIVLDENRNILKDSLEFKIAQNYKKYIESYNSAYKFRLTKGQSFKEFILKLGEKNQVLVNKEYLAAATIDVKKIKVWFNNQPLHAAPLALNLVHNAIARTLVGPDAEIIVTNYPLPYSRETRSNEGNIAVAGFAFVLLIGCSMALITAVYAIPLIKENTSRCKLLQLASGVRIWIFWFANFLWDFLTLLIIVIIMFIVLAIAQLKGYSTFEELSRYFLLMFLFCAAVLPLTYLLSQLFTEPATGFATICVIYCFAGIGITIVFTILQFFVKESLIKAISYIFLISPHFSLTTGWTSLSQNTNDRYMCKDPSLQAAAASVRCKLAPACCDPAPYFGLKKPGILAEILILLFTGPILLLIVIFKDARVKVMDRCCPNKNHENVYYDLSSDEDVEAEIKRVKEMSKEEIAKHYLVLDRLAKYYNFLAVKYISLSVKGKECFGLLGVNGAGKTTTFKMLTGDESISSGDAYVKGISVKRNLAQVYKKIGYCPQSDALLEDLTGRETLYIFCLLRGVPRDHLKTVAENLANAFGFMKHIDKRIKAFSGGNKRKLSTALAVINSPTVIYLDEPTSGMDPAAKRQLWNMVCSIRDSGKLIVLTSHSMEECEALCTKVAIMVNGEFKCIGSTQHLKNKFSKGVVLKIQAERLPDVRPLEPGSRLSLEMQNNINKIKEAIKTKYESALLQSEYQSLLTFHIPLTVIKWSEIFEWMEKNRSVLEIEDYSISQTSLEDIFLEFARTQFSNMHSGRKSCRCYC